MNTIGATLHQQRSDGSAGIGEDNVERNELRRLLSQSHGVSGAEAIIDPDVVADDPACLLKPLCKRGEARVPFRIVRRETYQNQNTDAPHSAVLTPPEPS